MRYDFLSDTREIHMSRLPIDVTDPQYERLKALLQERIAEADRGEVDTRSFTEIAESVLNAGTKRG